MLGKNLLSCFLGLLGSVEVAAAQGNENLVSLPFERGGRVFTSRKNPKGGVDFCVQLGLNGKPRVVIPAEEAPLDAVYPITDFSVSEDGKICSYFVTQSDRRYEEIKLVDVDTGKKLDDAIFWTRFSDFGWGKDGFFYAGFQKPEPATKGYSDEKVLYHRLGTAQEKDRIVYQDPAHPLRRHLFLSTFDHRFFLLHILERVNGQLLVSEWFQKEGRRDGKFTAIQPEMKSGRTYIVDNIGERLILQTTYGSPKGKVIAVDTRRPQEANWKTILPEPIDDCEPVMGKMVITVDQPDGGNRALIYSLEGKLEGEITNEPGATIEVQAGRRNDKYVFVSIDKKGKKSYFVYDQKTKRLVSFK